MSARQSQPPKSTTPATPSNLRIPPLPPAAFYGQHNTPRPYTPTTTQLSVPYPAPPISLAVPQPAVASATPTAAPVTKGTGGRKPQTLRGAFTKECEPYNVRVWNVMPIGLSYRGIPVRALMYAFGDDASPAPDTVNVMEEMVIEYIGQLVCSKYYS